MYSDAVSSPELSLFLSFGNEPPARGPVLIPDAVAPRDRLGPVGELAHAEGTPVHEPHHTRAPLGRRNHDVHAEVVLPLHPPHDRGFVVSGRCPAVGHVTARRKESASRVARKTPEFSAVRRQESTPRENKGARDSLLPYNATNVEVSDRRRRVPVCVR